MLATSAASAQEGGAAPADPAQAPEGAEPAAGPPAPSTDAPDAAALQDQTSVSGEPVGVTKAAEQRRSRWAESRASLGFYMSTSSLNEDFEQSYNPYFAQVVSIDPRYQVNDKLSLTASIDVGQELTNSDYTTKQYEPVLGDMTVGASYGLPRLPYDIAPGVGLQLALPTSEESRARERLFSLSGLGSMSRTFTVRRGITLTPSVGLRADWYAATSDVLTTDAPYLKCAVACDQFNYDGVRNPVASFRQSIGVAASFPYDLSASVQLQFVQSRLYDLEPVMDPFGMTVEPRDGSANWRYGHAYVIGGEWRAHKHFALGSGFQTVNSARKPDGSLRTPFFNRFTQFFVTASAVY